MIIENQLNKIIKLNTNIEELNKNLNGLKENLQKSFAQVCAQEQELYLFRQMSQDFENIQEQVRIFSYKIFDLFF